MKMAKPFGGMQIRKDFRGENKPNLQDLAADLYKVYDETASSDYTDPDLFDRRNFETESMKGILDDIKIKLMQREGNSFKYIVTPFGGGKTHTMIAAYHKAKRWGVKTVVIVGTQLDASADTLWGEIEKQLNDNVVESMTMMTAPGVGKLKALLDRNQPVLILMDELLAYTIKASGVKVGDVTMASQVTMFLQDLTSAADALNGVCVVASFPVNSIEFAGDQEAKRLADGLLQDMGQMAKRTQQPITPVDLDDVPDVVRRRLFDVTDGYDLPEEAETVIDEYVRWCSNENILPTDDANQYKDQFRKTYPFTPDVINTLFNQWGSFPSFQRTRGVLRLLALVVHNLRNTNQPYITLADFDLDDTIIRQELISYTGDNISSIVRSDISGTEAIAHKVEHGKRCATVVFMMSFAMEGGTGASKADVKRAVTNNAGMLSSQVTDIVDDLQRKLHYMKMEDGIYKFTHELNLNSVMANMAKNISKDTLRDMERSYLKKYAGVDSIIWPESPVDIPDDVRVKYVILHDDNIETAREMMWNRGTGTRTFKNSVIVVCPDISKYYAITKLLKDIRVRMDILSDKKKYRIGPNVEKVMRRELKDAESGTCEQILNCYSIVYVPGQNGPERVNGMQSEGNTVSERVLNRLRSEHVHDKISPSLLLHEMGNMPKVLTCVIHESLLNAPGGRLRPISNEVVRDCIIRGVEESAFGLGYDINGTIDYRYYGETPTVTFGDGEYLLTYSRSDSAKAHGTGQSTAPYTKTRSAHKDSTNPVEYHEFRMDMYVNSISDLARILRDIDSVRFDSKRRIVVECTGGNLTLEKFNELKKFCLDLDPHARVTSHV